MLLLRVHRLKQLVAGHEDAVAEGHPHGPRLDSQEQASHAPPLHDSARGAQHGLTPPQILGRLQLGLDDIEGGRDAGGKASGH